MKGSYLFFFLLFGIHLQAQDLTGIWRGHFRNNNESFERLTGEDDRYKMEVQIAQRSPKFQAVTYSYKSTVFFGKAEAEGTQNQNTKKIVLREVKIVEVRMATFDAACIMTCFMQYSKLGDEEFLEGTFTSMNTRDSSDCGKGAIFLHKVPESDFYKESFVTAREKEIENEKKKSDKRAPLEGKKTLPLTATLTVPKKNSASQHADKTVTAKKTAPVPASGGRNSATAKPDLAAKKNTVKPGIKTTPTTSGLAKSNPVRHNIEPVNKDSIGQIDKKALLVIPKVLTSRANELVKTITVNNPEVQLNIYDDGVIDNDTVSVYFDKKLILSRAMLTDKAIVINLHLEDTGEMHELVMVAENEGDIPPNTSLMIVKAGNKEYEVRIVSTEQKNAVVHFKYEKPD